MSRNISKELGPAVLLGLDWHTVVFAIAVIATVGVGRKMGVKRR